MSRASSIVIDWFRRMKKDKTNVSCSIKHFYYYICKLQYSQRTSTFRNGWHSHLLSRNLKNYEINIYSSEQNFKKDRKKQIILTFVYDVVNVRRIDNYHIPCSLYHQYNILFNWIIFGCFVALCIIEYSTFNRLFWRLCNLFVV